jgi:hypothetical protein
MGHPEGLADASPKAPRRCGPGSIRRSRPIGKIVGKLPIGSYHYSKQLPQRHEILCEVLVFLFRVERQLEDWPEKAQRETRWFELSVASRLVDEGGLAELLRQVTSAHTAPRL